MLRQFSRVFSPRIRTVFTVSEKEYDRKADESLDRLSEYFDHISDNFKVSENFDVAYSYGVLTVAVSKEIGTYVINKQSPNKQIWLSSPISGPKRYDLTENLR
ncbi:unnamed protein product [Caenorhabditis angaria]|uniref:ferroxidase n=1 Tax=Caenorhabditis angaria TaxID=860376 RepID=A0A9P1I9E7_9PELO|nr:unnamed protein product [Caenorhabditis angaria]